MSCFAIGNVAELKFAFQRYRMPTCMYEREKKGGVPEVPFSLVDSFHNEFHFREWKLCSSVRHLPWKLNLVCAGLGMREIRAHLSTGGKKVTFFLPPFSDVYANFSSRILVPAPFRE